MNLPYVWCLLAGLSALPGSVGRGEAAAYIGSAACGKCHPAEYAGQSQSGHAWALRRATDHPLAKYYTSAGNWRRDPSFLFEFSRKSDQFIVQAFDFATRQSLGLPVEWAFGAGRHAVTFVSRASGDVYIEYAFSFYPDSKTMDLTPGHRLMQADSLPKAMGVLHKIADPQNLQGGGIEACFRCHSTGPVERTAHGLKPSEPGVRCEVCHGPGRAHIKAVMEGRLELARGTIQNPRRMGAEKINEFCGSCHRFPGPDFAVNWNAVWNVR